MNDRLVQAQLLPTPFFSSFVGRARPGERMVGDLGLRAATWTSWALEHTVQMTGFSERAYPALVLDGRFYNPKGGGITVRPHLEIPKRVLDHADGEFPDRLALIGNGLAFEWWVMPEIKAVRRSLFTTAGGSLHGAIDVLGTNREPLIVALESLMRIAAPQWNVIEGLLITLEDGLSGDATSDFSADDVARYFPAGAGLHLKVSFDGALVEDQGRWAARKIGVWQISGVYENESFSFGVLTPRLTASSLFRDKLFSPETESPAALLVRGLILERLVRARLNDEVTIGVAQLRPEIKKKGPRILTIVAHPNQDLPQASMQSATNFLQHYETAEEAWEALVKFASNQGTILTTAKEGYVAAYRNAQRYLRRAEEPPRDDINVILPIGWDKKQRVVRFTFSRPGEVEE